MKILFTAVLIATFSINAKSICFGQKHKTKVHNSKTTTYINNNPAQTLIPDFANLFAHGYLHLKGKIGNSDATIDINSSPDQIRAYVFCDSLKSINGFQVIYENRTLKFSNDDWLFTSGINAINEMEIVVKDDSTFIGFVRSDSVHKKVQCIFKENTTDGHISMNQHSFAYENKYRNFPVNLSECILFADSFTTIGRKINTALLKRYDLIGQNYGEVLRKLSFVSLAKYKNVKDYKSYCVNKFITAYKNIISKDFLEEAKESGHTDVYLNSLTSEVIWNDGSYLVMQVIINYADGNAYPYYDTFIFEYDLKNSKDISFDKMNKNLFVDDSKVQEIIANLKEYGMYDNSQSGDKWYLSIPQIAFLVKNGVALYRTGGNHGIHYFYRYYPEDALAPILK